MNYTNRNQNIDIYFREISRNSSMSREDEIRLFTRISKGDKSAETEIFNKVAKLAVAIAKTYTCKSEMLEDLIQEANLGVIKAIYKFDLSTGWRFSSYVRFWSSAMISKFLNEQGMVHKTSTQLDSKIRKIKTDYWRKNGRDISVYELMDALEEMGERVSDPLSLEEICITSISSSKGNSEDDFTEEDSSEFNEVTASRNEFEEECDKEQLSYDMRKLLRKLDERERVFVMKKFGIGYDYTREIDTITAEYNATITDPKKTLTEERVRQIIATGIKKMRG